MKITVTEEHIRRGKRGKEKSCPIALAVKERFPWNIVEVDVDGFVKIDDETVARLNKIETFVHRFDSGLPVKPFSFMLDEKGVK